MRSSSSSRWSRSGRVASSLRRRSIFSRSIRSKPGSRARSWAIASTLRRNSAASSPKESSISPKRRAAAGRYRQALSGLTSARRGFPKSRWAGDALWYLGFSHYLLGEYDEALPYLEELGRAGGALEGGKGQYWRARTLTAIGRTEEGTGLLSELVASARNGDEAIRALYDTGLLQPLGHSVDSSVKFKVPLLYRSGLGVRDRRQKPLRRDHPPARREQQGVPVRAQISGKRPDGDDEEY